MALALATAGFVLIVVGVVRFFRRRSRAGYDVPALVLMVAGGLLGVAAAAVVAIG